MVTRFFTRPKNKTAPETSSFQDFQSAPRIAVSALLSLVSWYEKREVPSHGGDSCLGIQKLASPPRQSRNNVILKQFWVQLEPRQREKTLNTLSRIIAKQLALSPTAREVGDEQST